MIRHPAVAHQFYPGDPQDLKETLTELIPPFPSDLRKKAFAVISPHAGYMYSGKIAGETFSRVNIGKDVIILGPNHHGLGEQVAVMHDGLWEMPIGSVPVNTALAKLLIQLAPLMTIDETAHRHEHSLEVQVPFLQYFQPNLSLVPIALSHIPYALCEQLGKGLASAIKAYNKEVLLVASSDMTHYESRKAATQKDRLAIDRILALDPQGLYQTVLGQRITMCGVIPATVALIAALELGATKAELVRYTDSGEASGDTRQVVGYAGLIVS